MNAASDQARARTITNQNRRVRRRVDRSRDFHDGVRADVERAAGTDIDQDTAELRSVGMRSAGASHHWRKTTQTVVLSRTANSVAPQGFF